MAQNLKNQSIQCHCATIMHFIPLLDHIDGGSLLQLMQVCRDSYRCFTDEYVMQGYWKKEIQNFATDPYSGSYYDSSDSDDESDYRLVERIFDDPPEFDDEVSYSELEYRMLYKTRFHRGLAFASGDKLYHDALLPFARVCWIKKCIQSNDLVGLSILMKTPINPQSAGAYVALACGSFDAMKILLDRDNTVLTMSDNLVLTIIDGYNEQEAWTGMEFILKYICDRRCISDFAFVMYLRWFEFYEHNREVLLKIQAPNYVKYFKF